MTRLRGLAGALTLAICGGPLAAAGQAKTFHGKTSQGRRVTATLNRAHELTDLNLSLSARCGDGHKRVFTVDSPSPPGVPYGDYGMGFFGGSFGTGQSYLTEAGKLSLDFTRTLIRGTVAVTRHYYAPDTTCRTGRVSYRVRL